MAVGAQIAVQLQSAGKVDGGHAALGQLLGCPLLEGLVVQGGIALLPHIPALVRHQGPVYPVVVREHPLQGLQFGGEGIGGGVLHRFQGLEPVVPYLVDPVFIGKLGQPAVPGQSRLIQKGSRPHRRQGDDSGCRQLPF